MRQLVPERGKLLCRRLAGKQRDATAARSSACRRDFGGVFDGNSLCIREAAETVAILAWVALHDSDLRQFLAIGLADIEHIGSSKTCDGSRSLFPFFFVLRFATNDGSKNQDALLALLHEAAKLIPGTEAGNITGLRLLRSDQQHIVKTVTMEASNGLEIAGERLAVARLQRSDELFRRPVCDFLDLF